MSEAKNRAIDIWQYSIRLMDNGNVWIEAPSGEGMEVKLDSMVALLDQFWADYF